MSMKILNYTVQFLTPAFLGNAEQSGQWRTPPFKALMRQWWRVAQAAQFKYDCRLLREKEGRLFGYAGLEKDRKNSGAIAAQKSGVRIRLDDWAVGKLHNWNGLEAGKVHHREVKNPVGPHLYLGYGPLNFAKGNTCLKINAAIQVGESARLSAAAPETDAPMIEKTLWLMDRFGTLGGRCRNGWGSFSLMSGENTESFMNSLPLRPWKECFQEDWPHALGSDERPLIWHTQVHKDWNTLMRELATIKIGLRTQFQFTTGRNATTPEERHWLSYPVTNHSVKPWGNNARLPNSLRFKVRKTVDGQIIGIIFHMPCRPPQDFRPNLDELYSVWQRVHRFLDAPAQKLNRSPA